SVRAVIVCILAGQTLRFTGMADASAFSIYKMSEPLRVVYHLLTTQVVFLLLVLFLFLLLSPWIIRDTNSVSVTYYLARLPIWYTAMIDLYLKLLSERKLYRINEMP
ncbi:hypothetical protein Tco_1008056, partial [Tanacetum coccineum]